MELHAVYVFAIVVFGLQVLEVNSISVDTGLGRVIGSDVTITARDKQFNLKTFLGIPYAKPPTGELRWKMPVPADAFTGPFNATEYGPACPQPDPKYADQSEDCLFLNIYVPDETADNTTSGHAVMVFIHGGGLETGSGSSYVSDRLAVLGNVIVVTINYRVGIFGFFSSGDSHIPGNMGMFDQHLAFKWINRNIAAFGGDAGRVTIFGQSAGASSVFFQGLFPENKGIVHRVISESGVSTTAGAFNLNPKPQFDFIVKSFGCQNTSVAESIKCLRTIDSQTVMQTLINLTVSYAQDPLYASYAHFVLSADGTFINTTALPSDISSMVKMGHVPTVDFFRSLDLMIGYNSHDGTFLGSLEGVSSSPDKDPSLPSREEFTNQLVDLPLGFYFGFDVVVPSLVKSAVISEYTNWSDPDSPVNNRDNLIQLWTDTFFGKGINELAIMHTNTTVSDGNTFFYHFSAPVSLHAIATPDWVEGANHGDELGYVFSFNEDLLGYFNETYTDDNLYDWEWKLSDQIIRYWSNFAKSGDPNGPENGNPVWPQYDMADQIAMDIGKEISDESQMRFFNAEKNHFWLETVPAIMEASTPCQDQSDDITNDSDNDVNNAVHLSPRALLVAVPTLVATMLLLRL